VIGLELVTSLKRSLDWRERDERMAFSKEGVISGDIKKSQSAA
jgi:hypothetical protein